MNKLDATKLVAEFIVGAGVSKIVKDVISNNINDPENVASKVTVVAGAVVLGMMAKDASKTYVSTKIDSTIESFNNIKTKVVENQKDKS